MFYFQLFLLPIVGFVGILFNWLLILAIQRKTYHYQYSQRSPSPTVNKSVLRSRSSVSTNIIQPPLLPSVRSSISIFDKFILALLINDIFVCNFLIPLRLVDISKGLPFGFLCFTFKVFEKLTAIVELIVINLLLIISLIYFWKKRLLTAKLWLALFVFILPVLISGFLPTLTFIDVEEHEVNDRPPTCKQLFIYVDLTTYKTMNILCCLITHVMTIMSLALLVKLRVSIGIYKQNALKNLTEASLIPKMESPLPEPGAPPEYNRRRSMYYSASIHVEPVAPPTATPSTKTSPEPIDYITYLTVTENSHTLVRSTCFILVIYLILYVPYWLHELSNKEIFNQIKDIFFLCHILKPFCYMLTNEKYRHHVWAIIKCKTFRMLPNIMRRKSQVLNLNIKKHSNRSFNY